MFEETLAGLASAGAMAVVKAAGTDAWVMVRDRVARLLSRGDANREVQLRDRLDQTAAAIGEGNSNPERGRLEAAAWQARLEDRLEGAPEAEREQLISLLREAVALSDPPRPVLAGQGSFAVGGNADIHAEGGSVAAGVIHGGVHQANPPRPGSDQG